MADRKYLDYCLNDLQRFYGQGRIVLLNLRKQWRSGRMWPPRLGDSRV